ncbi:hypothetical protein CHISP_1490 [Chitinispirillum alkaliphilum]|nr:hypothetical protein CHISP_1490 [Chitinispirillum alkaliphilum]
MLSLLQLHDILLAPLALYVSISILFHKDSWGWWKAIIPFYNYIVLCDYAGKNSVAFKCLFLFSQLLPLGIGFQHVYVYSYTTSLFLMIPVVFWTLIAFSLANKHDKGSMFALGLIFLPLIFFPYLALTADAQTQIDDDYCDDDGDSDLRLLNINRKKFMKLEPHILEEGSYSKIVGGKIHTDIGYLIIASIPLWIRWDEHYMFFADKGIFYLVTQSFKGVIYSEFTPYEKIHTLNLEKTTLTKKIDIFYKNGLEESYECSGTNFNSRIIPYLDQIHRWAPHLKFGGKCIPENMSDKLAPSVQYEEKTALVKESSSTEEFFLEDL